MCDEYINPTYDEVEGTAGYGDSNCTGPRGGSGDWYNNFDGATGILAGAAVGYSFAGQNPNSPLGGLRVELEYFYRQSKYDETADVNSAEDESGDKLQQELVQTTDRIGSMDSHNIFGNVYYDFANTGRFTPYIGIGGGIGVTNMDYGSVWQRNHDATRISTGGDPDYDPATGMDGPGVALDNALAIQRNLAGTGSFEDTILSDTLYGLQILFGVDYAVTEAMSLGLKGRWVRFGSFDSGNNSLVWDPLRGHPPNLRTDGGEPVSGGIRTNNVQFFGISLNMKYHF